jgi:hypothetical protein
MRTGGNAHGYWSKIDFDPEGVAHARLRCDPSGSLCVVMKVPGALPRLSEVALTGHRRIVSQPLASNSR